MWSSTLPFACATFAAMIGGGVARADSNASAAADALFRQGRAASERGDAAAACVYFADSYKLEPTVGTLLNVASCSKALGRTASALGAYKEALDRMSAGDDRRSSTRAEVQRLEPLVPRVVLTMTESPCAEMSLLHDAKRLPGSALGLAFAVDPGEHEVQLACAGFQTSTIMYTAHGSKLQTVAVRRGKLAPQPVDPTPPPPPVRAPESKTWSWVALGAGGTLLVAGGVSGVFLLEDASTVRSDCDTPTRSCLTQLGEDAKTRGRTLEWTTPVLLGAGAILGGIGAYGLLFSGGSKVEHAAGFQIHVHPAGFNVQGAF